MEAKISAPLLGRIKSWQLFCLGITGWITLYSAAILSWGASAFTVGNAQGGCFATAMTLAGVEARRFRRGKANALNSLRWVDGITTEHLNLTLAQNLQMQKLKVEATHPVEAELGFGLRAVKAGRTVVFETSRWKEPVIDLSHAQSTEANRNKIRADLAVIVGVGTPDEDTKTFVHGHFLKLLVGKELRDMFPADLPLAANPEMSPELAADEGQAGPLQDQDEA